MHLTEKWSRSQRLHFFTYGSQALTGAMQKGHDLCSCANSVGRELAAGTGGNAVFGRPCHSPGIVAARGNVGKAAYALRLRQAPPRAVVVSRISSTLFLEKPLHFYRDKKRRNYAPETGKNLQKNGQPAALPRSAGKPAPARRNGEAKFTDRPPHTAFSCTLYQFKRFYKRGEMRYGKYSH